MTSPPPPPPGLSVFFPAYNDSGTIASLVIRAVQVAETLTPDYEVIVINDGSRDETPQILDELARVYPDYFQARHLRAWPVMLGFDLVAALTLALATMTMGVMGGFALIFVPAWIVFLRAPGWRRGLLLATLLGVAGYTAAFMLALWLDQPFGPVLALLLIVLGLVIA